MCEVLLNSLAFLMELDCEILFPMNEESLLPVALDLSDQTSLCPQIITSKILKVLSKWFMLTMIGIPFAHHCNLCTHDISGLHFCYISVNDHVSNENMHRFYNVYTVKIMFDQ